MTSSNPTTLSEHFSWEEVTASQTASAREIPNLLPACFEPSVIQVSFLLERVRSVLGSHPLHINSWYRCKELNKAVGGSPFSDHMSGEAVDFTCPAFGTPLDICRALLAAPTQIQFKQLILEHTWVHISFDTNPNVRVQKQQVLSLLSSGGYSVGLTDINGNKL